MEKYEIVSTDGHNVIFESKRTEFEVELYLASEKMSKVTAVYYDNKDVTHNYIKDILKQNLKYHTAEIERIKEILAKRFT